MHRVLQICLLTLFVFVPDVARGDRYVYEPILDAEDGELIDSTIWRPKTWDATFGDLLLTLGSTGGSNYANHITFLAPDLAEGQTVEDVRLRVNMQGGAISAPLDVVITSALGFDPVVPPGPARLAFPRTVSVPWHITAAWDSSGQKTAKWVETPNLAPIVNQVLAQSDWEERGRILFFYLEAPTATGEQLVRHEDTHPRWWNGGNAGIRPARLIVNEAMYDAFWGKELLCRPTTTSVEVNVVPHTTLLMSVQYGLNQGVLDRQTPLVAANASNPAQIVLGDLIPNTRYYYRLKFRLPNVLQYQFGPVHSFLSLPGAGKEARICVTADCHVTNQLSLGYTTMMQQLEDTFDYMPTYQPAGWHAWIDLGDLVVIRATREAMDLEETEQRYREAREYVDRLGHSVPLLFVRGNHEEINGWDYDGTPDNTMVWSGKMMLKWFPPPLPNSFYDGNTVPFPEIGMPGNYWSCRIGDLRLRAIDPYLYSPRRPHNSHGEVNGSLDGWDWQIGDDQYQWLHDDLAAHPAPYSLLALHHLTTCYTGSGEFYGRGGIEIVDWSIAGRPTFEWGGQDETGADVIATKRPNWQYGCVHDMLVAEGNQVVMKGHDHFHARQALDGMMYLTVAKPDDTGEQTGNLWGWRYFTFYPDSLTVFQPNSGFLSLVVRPDYTRYDYVQTYPAAGAGTVLDSFTLLPGTSVVGAPVPSPEGNLTAIQGVAPNPARDGARVDFAIGRDARVRLALYDAAGRLVRRILEADLPAGSHTAAWDGRDSSGRRVAAGVYFAKLESAGRVDAVKMIVLR